MSEKITMTGKYGTRGNPRERVRVLCTDRPSAEFPVVALAGSAVLLLTADGSVSMRTGSKYDLVPLDESLQVTPGVYRMRNGKLFTVVYTKRPGKFPVLGYYSGEENGNSGSRDAQGRSLCGSDIDLVERVGDLP